MHCCELTPDNVNAALTRGSRLLWEMCLRCLSINQTSLPSFDLVLALRLTLRVVGGGGGDIPSALGVRAARAKNAVVSEPERSVSQIEHVWASSEPTITTILSNFVLPHQSSNTSPRQMTAQINFKTTIGNASEVSKLLGAGCVWSNAWTVIFLVGLQTSGPLKRTGNFCRNFRSQNGKN